MLAVKLGFADRQPADGATGYQGLVHWVPKLLQNFPMGPRLIRRRFEEVIQACTESWRKECLSRSTARDKMTMQTGMYAVQKTEKNMSRHLSMAVDALDRERRHRRSNPSPTRSSHH
jgi:hypothetical protein